MMSTSCCGRLNATSGVKIQTAQWCMFDSMWDSFLLFTFKRFSMLFKFATGLAMPGSQSSGPLIFAIHCRGKAKNWTHQRRCPYLNLFMVQFLWALWGTINEKSFIPPVYNLLLPPCACFWTVGGSQRTQTDMWRTCKLHIVRPMAHWGFKPRTHFKSQFSAVCLWSNDVDWFSWQFKFKCFNLAYCVVKLWMPPMG